MATITKPCRHCGQLFEARNDPSKKAHYCSRECSQAAQRKYRCDPVECPNCGVLFTPDRRQARSLATGRQKRVFCSPECSRQYIPVKHRGEGNPNWKGGAVESNGYRYVRMQRHRVSPYYAEHKLVAEQMIGRPLRDDEVVHHINGDKTDNRPENLMVMTRSEHMKLHAQLRLAEKGRAV